eukprot:g15901.t1
MNDLGNEGIAAEAIENAPLKNGNEYSEICHVDECSVSPTLTPSEEARTQVNGSERPPECRRYTREQLMALKSIALSNAQSKGNAAVAIAITQWPRSKEQAGDWQEEAEWDNPGEAESLTDGILGGDIRKDIRFSNVST